MKRWICGALIVVLRFNEHGPKSRRSIASRSTQMDRNVASGSAGSRLWVSSSPSERFGRREACSSRLTPV
jgi:hypothetical protein